MPQQPELDILIRAQAGDRLAFRVIVELYQGFLYSVAFRFLGNRVDAEDAVQETFIKLWKNFKNYQPPTKLSTWLYRIIVNYCLDDKKSMRNRYLKKTISAEQAVGIVSTSTPQTELLVKEATEVIHQAANQLVGKQKMIFVLRDLEGLDTPEVSALLTMEEDQIKSNLYHARKKVSEWIKENYQ